jgi:hypothetical protein
MDFKEFNNRIQDMSAKAKGTIGKPLTQKIAKYSVILIDDNLKSRSWEGMSWAKTKEGKPVKTDDLLKSIQNKTTDTEIKVSSTAKYARAMNEGYRGTQNVRGFTTRKGAVRPFTRRGYMPRRQFMPYGGHTSPKLDRKTTQLITDQLTTLFTL